jgi:acetylornithine/succinyldiaminopimelate/putrescine aminotransferase
LAVPAWSPMEIKPIWNRLRGKTSREKRYITLLKRAHEKLSGDGCIPSGRAEIKAGEYELIWEARGKGLLMAIEFGAPESPALKTGWEVGSRLAKAALRWKGQIKNAEEHRTKPALAGFVNSGNSKKNNHSVHQALREITSMLL